jgi:hypothetical protein
MTYDEIVEALKVMNEVPLNNTDDNFQRIIPAMFKYADGRIYRELLFLQRTMNQPGTLVARNRELALPASVIMLKGINLCTPAQPISLTTSRTPLERIPSEVLDFFWPQASARPGKPVKYALIGTTVDTGTAPQTLGLTVRFMPTPDAAYPVEFLGDIRPLPPANDNPETYLTVNYPELYIACCMVFAAGYQRDFGAQADDPARAMSWETQYGTLRQGVMLEAARMRGEGPSYTTAPPAPAAATPR